MWNFITAIPSLISGAFGTVNNITNAIANERIIGINATTERERIESAERLKELEARRDIRLKLVGHPWEPEKIAFYVWLSYFAKCVVWDTVLGLGVTPELRGYVLIWSGMIVTFYFGKRSLETFANILKR